MGPPELVAEPTDQVETEEPARTERIAVGEATRHRQDLVVVEVSLAVAQGLERHPLGFGSSGGEGVSEVAVAVGAQGDGYQDSGRRHAGFQASSMSSKVRAQAPRSTSGSAITVPIRTALGTAAAKASASSGRISTR